MNPFLQFFSGGGGEEGQYLAIEQGFCFIYFIFFIFYFVFLLFYLFYSCSFLWLNSYLAAVFYVISYPWS